MIILLLSKVILYLTLSFDALIHLIFAPVVGAVGLVSATALVFDTMWKVTMYLFAIAPHTFGFIYSYIYIFFMTWVFFHALGLIKSFIPRSTVTR